jgi:DNA-binding NarL/FixJ family response regulator
MRMEGFSGIFEDRPGNGCVPLSPVFGDFEELVSDPTLAYMVVDLNAFSNGVKTVQTICRRRPGMRLVVLGPGGNDNLIMDLILAGARAYLDLNTGPRIVCQAIDVVTSGSIWAPRRLLSLLIDRLLQASDTSLTSDPPHLTDRERQVLDLILMAHSNREISRELGIEEHTVQAHVGRLMRKTGADNRINLLMRSSNPELMEGAGIWDRRQGDRRRSDRHQGLVFAPPPVKTK